MLFTISLVLISCGVAHLGTMVACWAANRGTRAIPDIVPLNLSQGRIESTESKGYTCPALARVNGKRLLGSGQKATKHKEPAVYTQAGTKNYSGGNSSPPFQMVVLKNTGWRNGFTTKNALQLLERDTMTV